MSELGDAVAGRRVLVCVGSGGVGKTTVAAALGLAAALRGQRVLVCTIDPARRLASAMGLAALGNVEARVPDQAFQEAGLSPKGELFAMMLDVKRTWDDLVTRFAPDPARRDRILQNRLYQQMSAALAGSQEYMAMEKLHELATDRDYDLIVLDTPPTAHALDFLDAPERVLDFLGNDAARALLAPAAGAGRVGLRLAQLGTSYVARTLSRFTGAQLLGDLGEFLAGFHGMYDGFKARAAEVRALLARPTTGFVLVASPSPLSIDEALAFHQRLRAEGMPVAGLVANRVTASLWDGAGPLPDAAALAAALEAAAGAPASPGDGAGAGQPTGAAGPLADRLAATLAEHQALAEADARALARLFEAAPLPRAVVPRLELDVHDLAGLARLAERL
ncbi:MAG: ArsA family ATPase [Anaeromyxobacter sp.]|nr:ArsA family ATPase [Anaeromyxobacter sp.]MBL0277399.1 ArsA family ATPase [Anaeromyxobacter sp.]